MKLRVTVHNHTVTISNRYGTVSLTTPEQIEGFAKGIRQALQDPLLRAAQWPGASRAEVEEVLAKVEGALEVEV